VAIVAMMVAILWPAFVHGEATAKITGRLFTIGADQVMTAWPGARVTLKNTKTQNAVSTVTNERGEFSQIVAAPGEYELTAALAGFETEVRILKVEAKTDQRIEIQLRPMKREEQVVVKAAPEGVEIAPTVAAGPTLTNEVIESVPLVDDHFENALPLIPGVVRGPDGSINIKGGRANQSNTLLNSSSVADPVTGRPEIELPPAAVDSVRVLSNPFSSEYGRFAGGVVELETKSGTDQWKFLLDGFFPRPRYRSGHILGIENITPRITASQVPGDIEVSPSSWAMPCFGDASRMPTMGSFYGILIRMFFNDHAPPHCRCRNRRRFSPTHPPRETKSGRAVHRSA